MGVDGIGIGVEGEAGATAEATGPGRPAGASAGVSGTLVLGGGLEAGGLGMSPAASLSRSMTSALAGVAGTADSAFLFL